MINQNLKNCINFVAGALVLFLVSLMLRIDLIIPVFILSLVVYLKYRKTQIKNYSLLSLGLLFILIVAISYLIESLGWSKFYIPFCFVPMLTTILFNDLELSLLMTLATSVTVSSFVANRVQFVLLFFISGLFASVLVLNLRRRIKIIHAGLVIGVAQAWFLFLIDRFWIWPPRIEVENYIAVVVNAIASSILVLGILPLFEGLFNRMTNISLLELADFDHPLLQKMMLEAPGTYHHSLIVGNISEAACQTIGANALLARIGSYYHDIGKLSKPEYFTENQDIKESKHETLAPTISKMVIINHVKEGIEFAKKYKLSPQIIDFIRLHHGSSLVYYFYRRALENSYENQEIEEDGFRYPGPKPNSKETAVVLLADSVEAASRAIKDPDPAKIQEMVHKVINNKFIDGQLDECDLTLKDLEKISAVFIRLLCGIYHKRVSYGEKEKNNSGAA